MITIPNSEYFTLRPLKNGVYAAIAKVGSPVFSNAGIIDTGDHILIFDTFNTYRAAEDLRRDTEILTRKLVDYVINSHAHPDHWSGNQVFADHAKLFASRPTQDAMQKWANYYHDSRRFETDLENYIGETEKNLKAATDPRLRAHLSWSLTIEQHKYGIFETTELHIPHNAINSKLDIFGEQVLVRVLSLGPGHSADDAILVLPDEKIAFIGDLGFFETHPYLGDCDPQKWVAILDDLIASKIRVFIPGHGPVGTKSNLLALKEYILTLQSLATDVVMRGGSEEAAANQPVPDFAANWAGFGHFEKSMRFLYRKLKYQGRRTDHFSRVFKQEFVMDHSRVNNKESETISEEAFDHSQNVKDGS
jgi:glyoxylase-like metal-dependent hydrolase (beta-lactamase superfamily II)